MILKNVRIIPELTPEAKHNIVDIEIQNGKIINIAKANTLDGENTYDMTGKTVIPGLIDAHVHLDLSGINTFEENVEPNQYRVLRALKLAQDNLKKGYTTLRDVGDRDDIIISLAKATEEELVIAPDIIPSGRILSPTEAGNDFFGTMYYEVDSPMEFRKAVRTQYQKGAKLIKVMGTGAVMNPGGEPGSPIIMEDELKALVEAANYVNLPVAVHCHGTKAIKMCIKCGVRTVEHSTLLDDEAIRMYQETDKTFPIFTLAPLLDFTEHSEGKPAHYVEKAHKFKNAMIDSIKAAKKAGIKIGWGTDAGVYAGSHGDGIYEFRARVNLAGFTPLECIIQATKNNAEILQIDDTVGTIEIGKKANLAIYNGNPDENIDVLENIAMVIKNGKIITI